MVLGFLRLFGSCHWNVTGVVGIMGSGGGESVTVEDMANCVFSYDVSVAALATDSANPRR